VLTWSQWTAFLLAVVLISLSPGPAFALIIRTSALHGWRRAMAPLAGAEVGIAIWATLAALGVAGVVAASATAFTVLKVVGAGVLVLLGVQAWRNSFRVPDGPAAATAGDPPSGWAGFGTGLATNLANPKAMVFCLAFFPQFIPPTAPAVPTTMALLAVMIAIDTVWFTILALTASRARGFFGRARIRRGLDRVAGTVFIGLAARMATLVR
jgi:threonine/homoserine/homoserine lactone efflux protein